MPQPSSQSLGQALQYATVANQLDINALAAKSGFISIKNGKTQITAASGDFGGGNGTASLSAKANGTVQLFSSGGNSGQGTVSLNQGGTKFFQTNDPNTQQQVSTVLGSGGTATLKVKSSATNSSQSILNQLETSTPAKLAVIGGVVGVAILLFVILK